MSELNISKEDIEKFWFRVDKSKPNGCWEYTGYVDIYEYGKFWVVGCNRMIRAHRFAWEVTNGPIPFGKMILHLCNNKTCVNPDHLYCGTHCNNMTDAITSGLMKGREAKLYAGEIWLIRKLKIPLSGDRFRRYYKFPATMVGKMFKVTNRTILNIWNSDKHLCKEGYLV